MMTQHERDRDVKGGNMSMVVYLSTTSTGLYNCERTWNNTSTRSLKK